MLCASSKTLSRPAVCASRARPAARMVVTASAEKKSVSLPLSSLAASVASAIVASPAFALVDDRLNGDGTGLVFGVNDPALGWVLAGVFGTMWAIWFTSQKDLGDFEDDDAGLRIRDD